MMMSERLTTERIAEIVARRAAITDEADDGAWYFDGEDMSVDVIEEGHTCLVADVYVEHIGEFIAHAPTDIDALLAALEAERAANERLHEKMKWLGKGKMRPLEQRYQAFLRHDAEHGYDDTPPDYVEWLEQIAMGDIHLVVTPVVNPAAGQDGD